MPRRKAACVSALRIGLFSECYRPIRNGVVVSVETLAAAIRSRGHAAVVLTPAMPGHARSSEGVARLPSLPLPSRTAYRLTLPLPPRGLGALSLVHAHSPFVTGALALAIGRRARVPVVFTYHTQLDAYAHYVPLDARLVRTAAVGLTRLFAEAADATVVPTAAMERRLRSLGVRSRIAVVPSGIDVAAFAAGRRSDGVRARFGVGPGERMVLAVGRLAREKDLELALEAFARLGDPAARFVSIGDGPHRAAVEAAARTLGIAARTRFAPALEREELADVYASCDAFVFASRTETQGLVLAEALAAGAAVVAADSPQTREVLGPGGRVVAATAAGLAEGLRQALATGPRDRGCDVRAASALDAGLFGDRMLALYAELVAAGGATRRN